jgi:hypothetical protein
LVVGGSTHDLRRGPCACATTAPGWRVSTQTASASGSATWTTYVCRCAPSVRVACPCSRWCASMQSSIPTRHQLIAFCGRVWLVQASSATLGHACEGCHFLSALACACLCAMSSLTNTRTHKSLHACETKSCVHMGYPYGHVCAGHVLHIFFSEAHDVRATRGSPSRVLLASGGRHPTRLEWC